VTRVTFEIAGESGRRGTMAELAREYPGGEATIWRALQQRVANAIPQGSRLGGWGAKPIARVLPPKNCKKFPKLAPEILEPIRR
jgi:hypothetical protein